MADETLDDSLQTC